MKTLMDYTRAEDWVIAEKAFNSELLDKVEAIMSLGNGYMGLRSATEERYLKETRNLFVAGTFNKFHEDEVTELPNGADLISIEFFINGEYFTLDKGSYRDYRRELNIRTGELHRCFIWISPKGDEIDFHFYRIVSLKDIHVIAQRVEVKAINKDLDIKILSGIDGRMTNSGSQHFTDGEKRFYHKKYMQFIQSTTESNIDFVHTSTLSFFKGNMSFEPESSTIMDRRRIYSSFKVSLKAGEGMTIEKVSNVHTSRDLDNQGLSLEELQDKALKELKSAEAKGYISLAHESAKAWEETVWNSCDISISSAEAFDQLAIRFAQYHLRIMTPYHDNRMSIGAKGISGEGYKGHSFWDTEIFILPYYIFTNPKEARRLLEYRYLTLPGARRKARENNYRGAMFPWESAWLEDGEVTPVWGSADIVTGMRTKIWSGFIEQHISADIAFAVWQYYMATGDQEFMDTYGYEIIFDTAIFWTSRLEYSEEDKLYHINDVVGPDEYKEHVDDNAFTNYMAYWNIEKAMEYCDHIKANSKEVYHRLDKVLDLRGAYREWLDKKDKIYLPRAREEDGVMPQDKTYLTLEDIDLSKYKKQEQVGLMFLDYNLEQVNKLQVSKQADIMMLFFLLEGRFSMDIKKANWNYYEPRTLHDSSLSLSTHCVLASDMGDRALAYNLYKRACRIDLGENMHSSKDGIHAASIGGMWQCIVYGFGGVRMVDGHLRIEPRLPEAWRELSFTIEWRGQALRLTIDKQKLIIENLTGKEEVTFLHGGRTYRLLHKLELAMNDKK
ncbi:glycoside hydrolase family 65 protein [Alloiococcus sp. CFN-8]|uniref:glycoside hydrolase family 65 protein n=1 Tax=Alloiococcus sp. CFN-8 TaxID=3416081 RepID=UPI003CF328EB